MVCQELTHWLCRLWTSSLSGYHPSIPSHPLNTQRCNAMRICVRPLSQKPCDTWPMPVWSATAAFTLCCCCCCCISLVYRYISTHILLLHSVNDLQCVIIQTYLLLHPYFPPAILNTGSSLLHSELLHHVPSIGVVALWPWIHNPSFLPSFFVDG